MAAVVGHQAGCPCTNATQLFADARQFVQAPSLNYGSFECRRWSAVGQPACQSPLPPPWCEDFWCYVDPAECWSSPYYFRRSLEFPQVAAFFSIDTCEQVVNGTGETDISAYLASNAATGETLRVGIPSMWPPYHFKRDTRGVPQSGTGPLYYDETVPWEVNACMRARALCSGCRTPWWHWMCMHRPCGGARAGCPPRRAACRRRLHPWAPPRPSGCVRPSCLCMHPHVCACVPQGAYIPHVDACILMFTHAFLMSTRMHPSGCVHPVL